MKYTRKVTILPRWKPSERGWTSTLTAESDPAKIWSKLKLSMWEGAGIFRTLPALEQTLSVIRYLQLLKLRSLTPENLLECCTVRNMLTTASLIVESALLRPESRGAHVRKDITQAWTPEKSPFRHTYISLSCRGIEKVSNEKIETPGVTVRSQKRSRPAL